MSEPKKAEAVKLVAGILFSQKDIMFEALRSLIGAYGQTDFISNPFSFSYTDYYFREMGFPLQKRFVAFAGLILPESLPDVKVHTNGVEKIFSRAGRRLVNIDPGYISRAHLVLATGKGYSHRPYLREGIYADLTLIYKDKSFQTLPWTYPDYGERKIRAMFEKVRDKYIFQLKKDNAGGDEGGHVLAREAGC